MKNLAHLFPAMVALYFCGCNREAGTPLSFYLSDQEPANGSTIISTNPPAMTVTRLKFVASDATQRKISIKFYPEDASAAEKLTTDNYGKTVVIVQGSNVLSVSRITVPVPAQAAFMFPVSTNLDFDSVGRDLLKLSH